MKELVLVKAERKHNMIVGYSTVKNIKELIKQKAIDISDVKITNENAKRSILDIANHTDFNQITLVISQNDNIMVDGESIIICADIYTPLDCIGTLKTVSELDDNVGKLFPVIIEAK